MLKEKELQIQKLQYYISPSIYDGLNFKGDMDLIEFRYDVELGEKNSWVSA